MRNDYTAKRKKTEQRVASCALIAVLCVLVPIVLVIGGVTLWVYRVDRALGTVRAQLETMPEGMMIPPRATRLFTAYQDPDCLIGDVHESLYTQGFGTSETPDMVLNYYRSELPGHGWQIDPTGGSLWTNESASAGWLRGALRLQVGIARQDTATPSAYPTVFRVRLSAPPACFKT